MTRTTLPIQRPNFRAEDFDPANGFQYVNQFMDQLVSAANLANGAVGPSVLPAGINMAGAAVTGLGTPTNETDAVPLGHANSQFGYAAQQGQLDIGKPYALKGLTGLWSKFNQLPANPQGPLAASDVTGSRAFTTVYQNQTGSTLWVSAVGNLNLGTGHNASALGYIGATSSPATLASANSVTNGPGWATASFQVPISWYYKVLTDQGTDTDPLTLVSWLEWS